MLKVDKLLSAARKVAKPLQKATTQVKEAVAPTATATSEVQSIGGRPKHLQKRPKPISTGVVYRNLDKHSKFQQKFKEIGESTIIAQGFTKLDPNPLEQRVLLDPQGENIEIPRLAHGLERVIKNAGLHPVRHNKKLNFTPFLHKIHPPETINFNAVPQFITSSRDETLHRLATQFDCKYKGSTSSVSSLLSHMYYLLSKFKPVNLSPLSPAFHTAASSFTPAAVKPAIVIVRPKDGVWSIDAEHGNKTPDNQILLELGKSLERMFTMTQEEFEAKMLKKPGSTEDKSAAQNTQKEAYIYSKMGSFLFRSQLDCRWPYEHEQHRKQAGHKHHHHDNSAAPTTPPVLRTFDLKSRAAWPIRIDCENYRLHLFYRPRTVAGLENSFEREFYDMVRAAFLKYIFQARIGKMEGIFVAYHNTTELLGFEYITLREMEQYIFDTPAMADLSFDVTTKLLQLVLDAATKKCPNSPFRLSLHTKVTPQGALDTMIGVEPLSNDRGWQEAETRDTNAFQINTPFYLFKLSLETTIDGKFTAGPFLCRSRDNVNIYYRLQEINADPTTMMQTYMGMLKASQLFFIEEEEE